MLNFYVVDIHQHLDCKIADPPFVCGIFRSVPIMTIYLYDDLRKTEVKQLETTDLNHL